MADDSFVHDESMFDPGERKSAVEISDAEAKYAELFREVIWDGVITADERVRLDTAAEVFGLAAGRAAQIEQALSAEYEVRHQVRLVHDEGGEPDLDWGGPGAGEGPPAVPAPAQPVAPASLPSAPDAGAVAPLAVAEDPGQRALQRRIEVLEAQNRELEQYGRELETRCAMLDAQGAELERRCECYEERVAALTEELAAARGAGPSAPAGTPAPAPADAEPVSPAPAPEPAPAVGAAVPPEAEAGAGAPPPEPAPAPGAAGPGAARLWRSRRVLRDSAIPPAPALAAERAAQVARFARGGRPNPADIHGLLRERPRDAELLHALFAALGRAEDLDRRWCIAQTLVHLGEANDEERATYVDHATAGLVRPARAVNEDEWNELLMHPDEDPLTGEILAAVARAVLLGPLAALRGQAGVAALDPAGRVEPKTSTLQIVRCFGWAAAILGMKVPPLYLAVDWTGTLELVPVVPPATRIGRQALADLGARELAFMVGCHLCWFRKEHVLGRMAGSLHRLEDVFLAALMVGNPGLPVTAEVKQRIEPLARSIMPLLEPPVVETLRDCFTRFVEQGGRTNLSQWRRAMERTALRTGMLLANDLSAARTILGLEDAAACEGRMDELIAFFTGERCSLLRKRIGIAVREG